MSAQQTSGPLLAELRKELESLLKGGSAHAGFDAAVEDFPAKLRGVVPDGLPYSAWQIVEHIRIAQEDMLHYSDNTESKYETKQWPKDYWPEQPEPPSDEAWEKSIRAIHADRKAFEKLLDNATSESLVEPFPWGEGQTLLKEALQIADHNAYHVGELIVLRRVLGAWKT